MSLEVDVPAPAVADVRVQLRGREIRVAEHLLHAAKVGSALEQVRRKRVPEQVGVDALGFEARLLGEPAQDQEDARARQAAALRVEEQLRPMAAVEVRPPPGEVAAQRLGGRAPDRDDPLLRPLAGRTDDPPLEVDVGLAQADRFADAQAGAVEQLDERAVA